MLSKRKWVNRCPPLETANNVTVCVGCFFLFLFFLASLPACQDVCLVEWRRLIIIPFACREVASIIFLGLHDKLQIAKVMYAILHLFCICIFATLGVCVRARACECVCVFVCENACWVDASAHCTCMWACSAHVLHYEFNGV